jgi:hypothetical protein
MHDQERAGDVKKRGHAAFPFRNGQDCGSHIRGYSVLDCVRSGGSRRTAPGCMAYAGCDHGTPLGGDSSGAVAELGCGRGRSRQDSGKVFTDTHM